MGELNTKEMSDESLLAGFAATKDEALFAELVQRYGQLVFSICKQMLGHTQDAEDAAQAVFLILAQKAASLRTIASLDGWLHRVAWRVALDARKMAQRRTKREELAAMIKEQGLTEPVPNQAEQWQQLHSEIDALPAIYRLPLVMHYFQARSREEIAKLLKANESTVSMRLTRGREMLKDRLVKSGAVLSAGLLAALGSTSASAMEVPAAFVSTTAKVASLMAKGNTAGIAASSNAVALAKGVLAAAFWAKLKAAALIAVVISAAATATIINVHSAPALSKPPAPINAKPAETKPVPSVAKKVEAKPAETILAYIGDGAGNLLNVISCQYHEKPLRETVAALSAALDVTIMLSASAEEKLGGKLVTLEMESVTGAKALIELM